jgi:hypothetical protein
MKLTDLDPRWACDADIVVVGGVARHFEGRHGMAVSFECPHCVERERATGDQRVQRLAVWFANPIDGQPPTDDATTLWQRSGETFGTLTLTPSIDASKNGHWHGFIVNGEIV